VDSAVITNYWRSFRILKASKFKLGCGHEIWIYYMGYLIAGILFKRKIKTGRLCMKITDKKFHYGNGVGCY